LIGREREGEICKRGTQREREKMEGTRKEGKGKRVGESERAILQVKNIKYANMTG